MSSPDNQSNPQSTAELKKSAAAELEKAKQRNIDLEKRSQALGAQIQTPKQGNAFLKAQTGALQAEFDGKHVEAVEHTTEMRLQIAKAREEAADLSEAQKKLVQEKLDRVEAKIDGLLKARS